MHKRIHKELLKKSAISISTSELCLLKTMTYFIQHQFQLVIGMNRHLSVQR